MYNLLSISLNLFLHSHSASIHKSSMGCLQIQIIQYVIQNLGVFRINSGIDVVCSVVWLLLKEIMNINVCMHYIEYSESYTISLIEMLLYLMTRAMSVGTDSWRSTHFRMGSAASGIKIWLWNDSLKSCTDNTLAITPHSFGQYISCLDNEQIFILFLILFAILLQWTHHEG